MVKWKLIKYKGDVVMFGLLYGLFMDYLWVEHVWLIV